MMANINIEDKHHIPSTYISQLFRDENVSDKKTATTNVFFNSKFIGTVSRSAEGLIKVVTLGLLLLLMQCTKCEEGLKRESAA